MRIKEIGIEGFGIFQHVTIPDIASNVTVFEGANEAGKTTLMAFIRAVLFGFDSRRAGNNRYEPVRGGTHGGALVVETADGKQFRIERLDKGGKGRVKVGGLFPLQETVSEYEKNRSDEAVLRQLVHGTSKLMYQNVFAFGIGELERLDTLQADEISQHIYTVGTGTGLHSLAAVQSSLETEQAQLFKAGGRKPAINQLLQELDHVRTTLHEMQTLPEEYQSLKERSWSLEREIEAHHGRMDEVETRRRWVEALVRACTDWEQLLVIRQEIRELPLIERFPAGGVERLEQAERTVASLETRVTELQSAIRQAEERAAQFRLDPLILKYQNDIEALEELRGSSQGQALGSLRARVAVRRQILEETLTRLGPTWNEKHLDTFDTSVPMRESVRGLRDRLETCRQTVLDAHRAQQEEERLKKDKQGELDRLQEKFAQLALPDSTARAPLEEREAALREWVRLQHQSDLTQQQSQDLRAQADAASNQVVACEAEIASAGTQRERSIWALIGIGLSFLGLSLVSGLWGDFLLTIIFITVGIFVVGLLSWWRHEFRAQRRFHVEGLWQKHQELMERRKTLEDEAGLREQHARQLQEEMQQLGQGVLGQALDSMDLAESLRRSFEAERRLLERREDVRVRIQDAEEAVASVLEKAGEAQKRVRLAEQVQEEAQAAWTGWLAGLNLPPELTPDGALEVMAGAERAQGQLREWRDVTKELEQVARAVQKNTDQLNRVLEQCGKAPVSPEEAPATLQNLLKAVEQNLSRQQDLIRENDVIAEKRADLEAAEIEKIRCLEQRESLLQAGGALDVESFRQRADVYARRVELERDQRQLETALRVRAGSSEHYQQMEQVLSTQSRTELERDLGDLEREGQRLGEGLPQKLQEKGRIEQRIQDLEQNEQLSNLLLKKEELTAQLSQQAQRWAVRSLCRHLLQKARELYERERQPAVLQEASKMFSVMTGGTYVRVRVPLGEMRLEVQTPNGASWPTEVLSRGTAEQLYLAMRLAFVREYAKHAGPLPVVVDDILVNFDSDRAKATIKVLGELASTHQVLVFTCHTHVEQWFRETLADVSVRQMPQCA